LLTLLSAFFISCKNKTADTGQSSNNPRVSVKTALIINGSINDIISLNGKSLYLKKNAVISSIPGYLKKVNIEYGDIVRKNELLFEIQTKENKALENSGLNTKTSSAQSGVISILSPSDGIVGDLNVNSSGIYIAEGSQLCTIVENKEMMVQVNVPYEQNQWIKINKECKVVLPDSTFLDGNIYKIMPVINEPSQTQNVLIKVRSNHLVPENLNVSVQFVKSTHSKALLIPKGALLTTEIQQEFWVMKILHDSLAVKVPVKKGFENRNMVEVLSPGLSVNDAVILEGAYGLPDNTVVNIVK